MIEFIVIIAIVGVILWYVDTYVPMQDAFKKAINIIAIIALLLYVLSAFGLIGGGVPKLR